jgi:TolB-like protein
MQCLEKDPGRRVQSVSEIRNTLEALRAGSHVSRAHQAIAVLPFDDVSQGRDQGYLCEGIAEEILIALARVPGLKVAPRTATFPLKAAGIGSLDAATRVNADAVLDGSVRRSADRLRVSVERRCTSARCATSSASRTTLPRRSWRRCASG